MVWESASLFLIEKAKTVPLKSYYHIFLLIYLYIWSDYLYFKSYFAKKSGLFVPNRSKKRFSGIKKAATLSGYG
jgi:hypothetical protein